MSDKKESFFLTWKELKNAKYDNPFKGWNKYDTMLLVVGSVIFAGLICGSLIVMQYYREFILKWGLFIFLGGFILVCSIAAIADAIDKRHKIFKDDMNA